MSTIPTDQSNPYAPPQADVADHRDSVHLAGRGRRFGAACLDGLGFLLCAVPLAVGIDFEALARVGAGDTGSLESAFSTTGLAIFGLATLVWLGINAYFVAKNSQSVGKRILSIKVARTDGSRASFSRIFWLRNIVNALPSVIPFIGNFYSLIDHLFIFGESRRCLHDRIADTIVVHA